MANDMKNSRDHHTSIIVDKDKDREISVVEAVENAMRAKLKGDSPSSATSCIFRVPQVLRRHNPEAYQPFVVSIGPFHNDRGSKQFQYVENVKRWYLHGLLSRMNISLKTLIQGIIKVEKHAREFYAEPLDDLNQNEFIEMMILDGCFIIELFRKFKNEKHRNSNDPIFNMDCMLEHLYHDLFLLENQLPWFVLESLYSLTMDQGDKPSLKKLVLHVFMNSQQTLPLHRRSYLLYLDSHRGNYDDGDNVLHILDLIRALIVFPFKHTPFGSVYNTQKGLAHPVTALLEANIKFKRGFDSSILNIDFGHRDFRIPKLEIGNLTETLFRNLIAFEQCYHGRSHEITSYVILMDSLIASSKDMDVLCDKKIIANNSRSADQDASQFFNKLCRDTVLKNFYYGELCTKLNFHYKVAQEKWLKSFRRELTTKERLKRDYLSSPWKLTSLIAAFILLVLAIVQTTYTIKQYCSPPNNACN